MTKYTKDLPYGQIYKGYKGFGLWPNSQRICLVTKFTKDSAYDQIYKGFGLLPNLQRICLMTKFTKDLPYDQMFKGFPL